MAIRGSSRGTVAIADENDSLRSLLSRVLEQAGYQVVAQADNGAEAISIVAAHRPDFVILGERMPYMTGSQAARLIRRAIPRVGIILWSGTNVEDFEGIDAVISKHHIRDLPEVLDALANTQKVG